MAEIDTPADDRPAGDRRVDERPTTDPTPAAPDRLKIADTVLAGARAVGSFLALLAAAALAAALVVAGISSGWFNDVLDQDQYQDRIDAISAVYRQGAKTRDDFARSGTTLPDEAACRDAFHRTGADREREQVARDRERSGTGTAFAELRRLSFVNGCLGRPNDLPATPLPPTPSSSPS